MSQYHGLEIRSEISPEGFLTLRLQDIALSKPGDDEVIVQVEATPINPSDLLLLFGPADISTLEWNGSTDNPVVRCLIPPDRLDDVRGRIGQSLSAGVEGAGTVVDAGENAKSLIGRKVAMLGGGMYAQYRKIAARDVLLLPEDATAAEGASLFVNPLTALAFVETMKMEGHKAIVHTAAASNLGLMLQKICLEDNIPLINIVRRPSQVEMLNEAGAKYALNSEAADFREHLLQATSETNATLAFDAIGGGQLGSEILEAMEQAANRKTTEYSRYGSNTFKQLYIYGLLNPAHLVINHIRLGFRWSVSGFLLTPFLQTAPQDVVSSMRKRVIEGMRTTFSSQYTATVSLTEALQPAVISSYERKATGEKYLIDPTR